MCEFVSSSDDQWTIFFAAMAIPDKKVPDGRQDGLAWYRVRKSRLPLSLDPLLLVQDVRVAPSLAPRLPKWPCRTYTTIFGRHGMECIDVCNSS